MVIDCHIHVGQFCDLYFAPSTIHQLLEQMNVAFYVVSSTTMCEENYSKVLDELQELVELDGNKVLPVMWITPEGLNGHIAWFLESNIQWRCLKVHPFLHQQDWMPGGEQFNEVIGIARELQVPLLIHTGNEACCQCGKYEPLIVDNPDIDFVLAHGRPLKQVIPILKSYPNAYADSAFMPVEDMSRLMQEGLSHKLLWGTDMCIPKHFYPQEDMANYYLRKLNAFKKISSQNEFEQVTFRNAVELFKIKIKE